MLKRFSFMISILIIFGVLSFCQTDRDKKINECQPLLKEAVDLHTKKDTDGAIKKVQEAIKKVPDYHNFYNLLAFLYSTKKDYKNQYLAARKTVEFYEAAKKRGETRNMTDIFYINLGAACVNYSYELRLKKDISGEVKLLKEGLKYFKLYTSLVKKGRGYDDATEQIKIIEKDLLPRAEKALKAKSQTPKSAVSIETKTDNK